MLAHPALHVPACDMCSASNIHLLRPRDSRGGSNTNVKAGDHHDVGLAQVNALLQRSCGLLQGHQILSGLRLQLWVHLDWKETRQGQGGGRTAAKLLKFPREKGQLSGFSLLPPTT